MELKTFPKVFFILFITSSLFYSCGKDDDSEVCCGSEIKTNADFDAFLRISGTDSIYWVKPLDTFYNFSSGGSKLYFRAESPQMNSYQWKVGTDPATFTDSLFFLTFGGINETIDVTLDVTNDDINLECFPDDTGIASQTKSIIMKTFETALDLPMYGKYEGYNEDAPNIIFQIEIGFSPTNNAIIADFPYQCGFNSNLISILHTGGRSFIYDEKANYPCGDPSGGGWLDESNQIITIEYSIDDENDSTKRVSRRFVGQKI